VKFGHVVMRYASGQTDRQTGTLITIVVTPPGREVKIASTYSTLYVKGINCHAKELAVYEK